MAVNLTLCKFADDSGKKETMCKPSSTAKHGAAKQAKIVAKVDLLKEMGVNEDEARKQVNDPKKVSEFLLGHEKNQSQKAGTKHPCNNLDSSQGSGSLG